MRKITLLIVVIIAISASFAATTRWFWYGDTPQIATTQYWDMGTTANWYDPTTVDPLIPFIVPDNFVSGTTAILDESAITGSDTLKLNGLFNVDSLIVNNTRTYVLRSKTGYTTDSITGNVFVKDGTGTLVMDCKNKIAGGTILKAGKITMEKTTNPNIFGTKLVFGGGTANFAAGTASTYPAITLPVEIPAGVTAKVELNRYSYWTSPISGAGNLEIAVGGDRCMLATSKTGSAVNWKNFTGNVTLKMNKVSGASPAYYGLLLGSTKAYNNATLASTISTSDSLMYNKKVTLKAGAGFTGCGSSGVTHCWNIGELQAENDSSFLGGYGAGASSTPYVYYMFGGLNTDVVFPGTIIDSSNKGYNYIGLVKIGSGKYTFTSTKSITTASVGVVVRQGTFLVNIPITTPATTTALGRASTVMTIKAGAIGGGNGRLTGTVLVDTLGTLVIGCDGVGTLQLADTLSGTKACPLTVNHTGTVVFKVGSKTNHDLLTTTKTATFNGGTILIKPTTSSLALNDGDSITILTAKTRVAVDSFALKVQDFPSGITFTASKDTIAGAGFKISVIAHVATGLNTLADNVKVSMYPNPAKGNVYFTSSDAEISSVEVLNLQGQVVSRKEYKANSVSLDIDRLATGIYYTKVITDKGTKVEKLIVR